MEFALVISGFFLILGYVIVPIFRALCPKKTEAKPYSPHIPPHPKPLPPPPPDPAVQARAMYELKMKMLEDLHLPPDQDAKARETIIFEMMRDCARP